MTKRLGILLQAILTVLVLTAFQSLAQTNEVSRSMNAGGGISSNSMYRSISSICQGQPIGYTFTVNELNHTGFLHGDEKGAVAGADTDVDGLSDWAELSGIANNPNTPSSTALVDTDGDLLSDWQEWKAGTNPLDAGSVLRIVAFDIEDDQVIIRWVRRTGRIYDLLGVSDFPTKAETTLDTVTAFGGVAPWFETESVSTNPVSQVFLGYGIEVQ